MTARLRHLAVPVLLLCLGACAKPTGGTSPEDLMDRYLAAVERGDEKAMAELVHPSCRKGLAELERRFLDDFVRRSAGEDIPAKRKTSVFKAGAAVPPPGGEWRWPVLPTHQLDISFDLSRYSSRSIAQYIAPAGKHWYVVLAYPDEELLKQYDEKSRSR